MSYYGFWLRLLVVAGVLWLLAGCAAITVMRDGKPETVICLSRDLPRYVGQIPLTVPCREAH